MILGGREFLPQTNEEAHEHMTYLTTELGCSICTCNNELNGEDHPDYDSYTISKTDDDEFFCVFVFSKIFEKWYFRWTL